MSKKGNIDLLNAEEVTLHSDEINLHSYNMSDWTLNPNKKQWLTFFADDFTVEKRIATIVYKQSFFPQQYHTIVFNIEGKEYRFERTN